MKEYKNYVLIALIFCFSCKEKNEIAVKDRLLFKRKYLLESSSKMPLINYIENQFENNLLKETTIRGYSASYNDATLISEKTVTTKNQYYYKNEDIDYVINLNENNDTINVFYYLNNSQNQIVEKYKLNFPLKTKVLIEKYKYDINERLIEFNYLVTTVSANKFIFFTEKYNYSNLNTKIVSYFDNNDELFGEIKYTYDGKKSPTTVYKLNKNDLGNIIKIEGTEKYKPKDGLLMFYPKNPIIGYGTVLQDIEYEYNQLGYPTKQTITFKNNNQKQIYGFEYL